MKKCIDKVKLILEIVQDYFLGKRNGVVSIDLIYSQKVCFRTMEYIESI